MVSFLCGLGFARFRLAPNQALVVLAAGLALITYRKRSVEAVGSIVLLGLVLGWARGAAVMDRLADYETYFSQKVVLKGVAANDGIYSDSAQLSFDLNKIRVLKPYADTLPGMIKVQGFGEPAVFRGDTVEVEGKLFLARGSRQGQISYASISVDGHALPLYERLRLKFSAGMQNALPEPLGSFGLGLLVGQRATLPKIINDQLGAVGLTHLIAVSGYNLTIIISTVRRLLRKGSKYQILCASLALMICFIVFTGLSASIVRAAMVSTLSLIAWYYGRKIRPLVLILLAAVLTAGWNPLYIWSDIGWWLSFMAFYGILVAAPLAVKRIYDSGKKPSQLSLLIIECLAAQIMTMPLVLYVFSQASTISLISNILLVPLVPLAMMLSLLAGQTYSYVYA
jgi:competence protein ComEC